MTLKYANLKKDIYSNVRMLAGITKWKHTYINDDLTPEQRSVTRDARSITLLARARGIDSKQKGGAVIGDGQVFPAKGFHNLPHNLSSENAKLVNFPQGCAFQGHHAYLSSMHNQNWDNFDYPATPDGLWDIMVNNISSSLDEICPVQNFTIPVNSPKWIIIVAS